MRVTDVVGGPFTPPGFYYKTFIRPRRLWPLYEKVLRHAAGLGRLRARAGRARVAHRVPPPPRRRARRRRRRWPGSAPRSPRREPGADVVLADEGPEPGGRAAGRGRPRARARAGRAGPRAPASRSSPRASALGYFDGLVPVWQGDTLHQVRARRLVFATGDDRAAARVRRQRPARRDARRRRAPAGRALRRRARARARWWRRRRTAASRPRDALHAAGVEVAAVADLRRRARRARRSRPRCCAHTRRGARQRVARRALDGGERASDVECDLLVVSGGAAPATSLLAAGRRAHRLRRGARPLRARRAARRRARGRRGRRRTATTAERSGERAGAEAAHALGLGERAARRIRERPRAERRARPRRSRRPWRGAERGKCFACLCEDVTAKDIHLSVDEGYDSIELSKRYTTVTMGPCQGRMCQLPAVRLMAAGDRPGPRRASARRRRGRRGRPVPMGALAGRPFEPAKRSSIHGRHRELGASVMWAGDWRRAYDYGDPQAEALAVHETAGLIDVSTLGKLHRPRPRGRRVPRPPLPQPLLEPEARPHPLRRAHLRRRADHRRRHDLPPRRRQLLRDHDLERRRRGRGVVLLVAGRLAAWTCALTDVTQALAAVNLAGPRAREIMGRAHRPRLLQRGVHLPRRQARADRRRARA